MQTFSSFICWWSEIYEWQLRCHYIHTSNSLYITNLLRRYKAKSNSFQWHWMKTYYLKRNYHLNVVRIISRYWSSLQFLKSVRPQGWQLCCLQPNLRELTCTDKYAAWAQCWQLESTENRKDTADAGWAKYENFTIIKFRVYSPGWTDCCRHHFGSCHVMILLQLPIARAPH